MADERKGLRRAVADSRQRPVSLGCSAIRGAAWGYEVDPLAMPDARRVLRKLGMVSKSKERNRRQHDFKCIGLNMSD